MNKIFLIGMMGSWKSTVGRKLAKELNVEFVDIDDCIEEVEKMKVSEIFNEFGEKYFRNIESKIFMDKTSNSANLILSTGGGIILDATNRKILREKGTTFLLEASTNTLAGRIKNTDKRPLLMKSNNINIKLEEIWNERKEFYKKSAKYIISTDNISPEEVIKSIKKKLEFPFAKN